MDKAGGITRRRVVTGLAAGALAGAFGSARAKALKVEKEQLKLGFIKLTDMAPLAIAYEKGFFEDEGLYVTLEPQANWKVILAQKPRPAENPAKYVEFYDVVKAFPTARGPLMTVDLPRPRSRRALLEHSRYYEYREELLGFLEEYDHAPQAWPELQGERPR